jgi:hypothetical protein
MLVIVMYDVYNTDIDINHNNNEKPHAHWEKEGCQLQLRTQTPGLFFF